MTVFSWRCPFCKGWVENQTKCPSCKKSLLDEKKKRSEDKVLTINDYY